MARAARVAVVVLAAALANVHGLRPVIALALSAIVRARSAAFGLPVVTYCRAWMIVRESARLGDQMLQLERHCSAPRIAKCSPHRCRSGPISCAWSWHSGASQVPPSTGQSHRIELIALHCTVPVNGGVLEMRAQHGSGAGRFFVFVILMWTKPWGVR